MTRSRLSRFRIAVNSRKSKVKGQTPKKESKGAILQVVQLRVESREVERHIFGWTGAPKPEDQPSPRGGGLIA